jgi:tRNA modification GTPase
MVQAGESIHPEDAAILAKLPPSLPFSLIRNKIDLIQAQPGLLQRDGITEIWLSAKHKIGLDILIEHLKQTMGYQQTTEGVFLARKRHLDALESALKLVENAQYQLQHFAAGELVAEDLRCAQQALASITGRFSSDDLLGRIFTSFCIGK